MAEALLVTLVALSVALAVAWPLLGSDDPSSAAHAPDPEREALLVRHRLALEALRDVEADQRAGSLDAEAYRVQLAEAEAHAAETLRALDVAPALGPPPAADLLPPSSRTGRRAAAMIGGGLALLLLVGYALPAPLGIAERDARLERIRVLTDAVAVNPADVGALAELSDQYLAGGTPDDVGKALASLLLLRNAEPTSRDAHQRLVTLFIRAGLWEQATAAVDAYAAVVGDDDADIPFFSGLIARGVGDTDEAIRQFDRFLSIAPDDPRATMVKGLRDQEAAGTGG
jgi:tetratricopeptide (TPR) repeat protein